MTRRELLDRIILRAHDNRVPMIELRGILRRKSIEELADLVNCEDDEFLASFLAVA